MSNEARLSPFQAPTPVASAGPSTVVQVPPTNVFATPAPPRTPEGSSRGRARCIVALVIALFIGECVAILLWVSTTTYGFTRILSLAFAYGVAFRIMRVCLAAIIWQLIRFRRARLAGSASGRRKRHAALALPVILPRPERIHRPRSRNARRPGPRDGASNRHRVILHPQDAYAPD